MKRLFLLIILVLSFVLAGSPIPGNAYVISAIGIKNVEGNVVWQSGSSNQLADGTYKLAPQVIVYDGKTEYVGAATPFTGCLNGVYYNSTGAPDGACFAGGVATSTQNGLISATDKAKLDGINLSNYSLTSHIHDDRYYTESEINTKLANVITTDNIGSQTVNRSSSAYRAERLLINGSTYEGIFHWSGQSGQPTWLWGSNDGANMYVWNPSNFSVNYASSSNYANSSGYASSSGNADTVDGYHAGDLGKFYGIDTSRHLATITSRGYSYTATENCFVVGDLIASNGGNAFIYIDGVQVNGSYQYDSSSAIYAFEPLKKGQTLTTRSSYGSYNLRIYEVK